MGRNHFTPAGWAQAAANTLSNPTDVGYYANAAWRKTRLQCRRNLRGVLGVALKCERDIQPEDMVWRESGGGQVRLARPACNMPLPADLESKIGPHQLQPEFVELMRGVRLLDTATVPFDDAGRIAAYALRAENYRDPFVHVSLRAMLASRSRRRPPEELELAVSLTNAWSRSYFHWFVEILPRLQVLQDSGLEGGEAATIVVHRNSAQWQMRSLEFLGLTTDRIHLAHGDLFVRRFLIPSFPRRHVAGGQFSIANPSILKRMRERILGAIGATKSGARQRILISRSKAIGRRLDNEEEVFAALIKYGFERHILEDLTFDDQVRLFSRASWVIGPHGAGLTNLLWCKDPANVVELCGSYANSSFYTLAGSLGHSYALFGGHPLPALYRSRSNFSINVDSLIEFLQGIGLRERE